MALSFGQGEEGKSWLIVKIAVVVVAVGAALFFTLRGNPDEEQLDTPESAEHYICLNPQCKHAFDLTPAEFDRLYKNREFRTTGHGGEESLSQILLRCPECGELTGAKAAICPKHNLPFPRRLEDNTPGHCPKCDYAMYKR